MTFLEHNGASALRRERERQGLSLRELGHFAGCSHMTIQRLELGTLDVAPATKARIARQLRVPLATLFPVHIDDEPAGNGLDVTNPPVVATGYGES
jgi:transcriptional regulator with XRE-family HTH domain